MSVGVAVTKLISPGAHLFKTCPLWKVESRIPPGNSIFSETAMLGHHLVECSHTVAFLKFSDILSNRFNDSGNVITRIVWFPNLGPFPVFGVTSI
jgi:hypothetical protein